MARPKKGEKPPGFYMPCAVCGKLLYRAPNRKTQKKTYCKEHKFGDAFHFPCPICKIEVYTQPAQVKYKRRSTCGSRECHAKLFRIRAEQKRQGYTKHQLDRLARYSIEAKAWRKAVFERDDYTCQGCGIRSGKGVGPVRLEADHIKPFAYFPELRYELANGRTLCRPCHDKTKLSAKKMREIYQKIQDLQS